MMEKPHTFSMTDNIVGFPEQDDDRDSRIQEMMLTALNAAVKVLNARLLCILALLGAMAFWGMAMLDPTVLKIICGASYSLGVLWPVLAMYSKRG
jgi:hypothetical protein